ncbi:helix-turn-helix domain-containing protein [Mediterraneibacter glycyrrhizinilyticus]|uniref:helix-turn-helix domain-containing protein n=1 Tax=Mediterraneibacter glycyrrhizinilyticus TaxID=342942 RepID=UPI0019610DBE|nr:helix-turn-helix domain-containing protein [Mediterraneibacter glycyrrhizinilyticus]MBM6750205.1 helix-turn-helix domain-containing protein [Mediterraneibacter glycyrrhizinilyticus]
MRLLSISEVAEIFDVTPETIRVWCSKGILKSVDTSGGVRFFYKEDVEAYKKVRDAYKNYQSSFIDDSDSK